MLEGLGHDVEPAWPGALGDEALTQKFMALWATQHGDGAGARSRRRSGATLTEDDVEPVNWVQAEFAARLSAVDYAAALAACYAFRREVQQWWADGWDLLLTPTLAEPPPPIAEFEPTCPATRRRRCAGPAAGCRSRRRST